MIHPLDAVQTRKGPPTVYTGWHSCTLGRLFPPTWPNVHVLLEVVVDGQPITTLIRVSDLRCLPADREVQYLDTHVETGPSYVVRFT